MVLYPYIRFDAFANLGLIERWWIGWWVAHGSVGSGELECDHRIELFSEDTRNKVEY